MTSNSNDRKASNRDLEVLRQAGLRVTSPRLATMDIVRASSDHPDVETIVGAVRERLGSVSRQTVYDVLRALSEAQIVRRISPEGRGSRYEMDYHDNHQHLLCQKCGALVNIPSAVGHVPCLLPPGNEHLRITSAEVIYHGLCEHCVETREAVTQ